MRTRIILPLLLAALAVAALPVPAPAAPTPAKKITELLETAKLTKGEFESLIQQLDRLAEMLENSKADLDTAKVLREAATAARGALISDNMDEVMGHIKRGLMTIAAQRGKEVRGALDEVLRILRQGTLTIDEKIDNLNKMMDTLAALRNLKAEQEKLEKESRPKANADELSQRMAAHAKTLAGIIKEQKDMLAQAGKMSEGKGAARKLAEMRDAVRDLIKKQ